MYFYFLSWNLHSFHACCAICSVLIQNSKLFISYSCAIWWSSTLDSDSIQTQKSLFTQNYFIPIITPYISQLALTSFRPLLTSSTKSFVAITGIMLHVHFHLVIIVKMWCVRVSKTWFAPAPNCTCNTFVQTMKTPSTPAPLLCG